MLGTRSLPSGLKCPNRATRGWHILCLEAAVMYSVPKSIVTPLLVWMLVTGNACSGSPNAGGSTGLGGTGGGGGPSSSGGILGVGGTRAFGGASLLGVGGIGNTGNVATGSSGNLGGAAGFGGVSAGGNTGTGIGNCPTSIPASGDSCSGSTQCSWGNHPLVWCRTQATCSASHWWVSGPSDICTPDPTCSAMPSNDQTCATDNFATCVYSDGTHCNCTSCCTAAGCNPNCGTTSPHHAWACTAPPQLLPNCPTIVPNQGSPCNLNSGTVCLDTCDLKVTCDGGIWHWNTQSCQQNNMGGVCASPDTPIATPNGERSIADIRVNDWVYSVDRDGIKAVRVARVIRRPVRNHHVIRVMIDAGRNLEISAPHPTADGRTFGDLRVSDLLDGNRIQSVEVIDYAHEYTYDILPDSDTGLYFAGGMLIGSTIASGGYVMSRPNRPIYESPQAR